MRNRDVLLFQVRFVHRGVKGGKGEEGAGPPRVAKWFEAPIYFSGLSAYASPCAKTNHFCRAIRCHYRRGIMIRRIVKGDVSLI